MTTSSVIVIAIVLSLIIIALLISLIMKISNKNPDLNITLTVEFFKLLKIHFERGNRK